jgi:hypothetical protein
VGGEVAQYGARGKPTSAEARIAMELREVAFCYVNGDIFGVAFRRLG